NTRSNSRSRGVPSSAQQTSRPSPCSGKTGNPWTDLVGYTNTTAMGATFVGQDAHLYAFRSIARDRAGNAESAPLIADTSTFIDVTRPFVTDLRPVGGNTNLTPWIVVTFSEPMNRSSVEYGFSI